MSRQPTASGRRDEPTGSGAAGEPQGRDLLGWALAPVGLVLVGAGLSVSIDAALRRAAGAGTRRWVGQGTIGLVVLNSGLSVFGDAVRRRAEAAARTARG
jgi:hypothetical protein